MYGILRVNTYASGSTLTFVRSYHEYSDICINMSQISSTCVWVCQLTPHIYKCKIRAYDIEYFSGACLLAPVGHALVVCKLILSNALLSCLSRLQFWQPSETLISLSLVWHFSLQAAIFWAHYRRECHLHRYHGWHDKNEKNEIPAMLSWNNPRSYPRWDRIVKNASCFLILSVTK